MTGALANKVAMVTGTSSGIGQATAFAFARDGAAVVCADISDAGGAETAHCIRERGGQVVFVHCDVANDVDVARAVDAALHAFGRLDYACNNAGNEGTQATLADYPDTIWDEVIRVNLTGVWRCMKHQIPAMRDHGSGSIVNMASILGVVGFANAAAYTAAKHGVIGLTQVAALDYATQGIRVNAVCPAFIVTPMLQRAGLLDDPVMRTTLENLHPMKRLGAPDEIAETVIWLCSDHASFVTGHAMLVDGRYTAQ